MAEAIRLTSRQLRRDGTQQLLPDERGERRVLRLAVRQSRDGVLVEDATLDRATLEHAALFLVQLVEASREERLDRRRHLDSPTGRAAHEREHLLQEERIALCGRRDARPQLRLRAAECVEQPLRLLSVERLEQNGDGVPLAPTPRWPELEELGTCHAQQDDRRFLR